MTVVNPSVKRVERVPSRLLRKIKHRQFLFTNHLQLLFNYFTTKKISAPCPTEKPYANAKKTGEKNKKDGEKKIKNDGMFLR